MRDQSITRLRSNTRHGIEHGDRLRFRPPVAMMRYAEAAAQALGLDSYSRMDFKLGEDGSIYCLEANTLPGMTATSLLPQEAQAIGMDYAQLCEKIIQVSLQKYGG